VGSSYMAESQLTPLRLLDGQGFLCSACVAVRAEPSWTPLRCPFARRLPHRALGALVSFFVVGRSLELALRAHLGPCWSFISHLTWIYVRQRLSSYRPPRGTCRLGASLFYHDSVHEQFVPHFCSISYFLAESLSYVIDNNNVVGLNNISGIYLLVRFPFTRVLRKPFSSRCPPSFLPLPSFLALYPFQGFIAPPRASGPFLSPALRRRDRPVSLFSSYSLRDSLLSSPISANLLLLRTPLPSIRERYVFLSPSTLLPLPNPECSSSPYPILRRFCTTLRS